MYCLISLHSAKTSSRFFFGDGSKARMISNAATAREAAKISRVTKMLGSPFVMSNVRRGFSSIMGPRMKPSNRGTGSQPQRANTKPMRPNAALS